MAQDEALAGIVSKKSLPKVLLVFAGIMIFISFFVGWFSVDASLQRWDYDEAAEDHVGVPLGKASFDLEMKMLSMETHAKPSNIEELMTNGGGPPSYDDAAPNSGTVMLGVLLLQVALGVCFLALIGFYSLQRRRKNDYSRVIRRVFLLFIVLAILCLGYFSFRIVGAAETDETTILNEYRLSENSVYDDLNPEVGFWLRWETKKTEIETTDGKEIWQFTVVSSPSGGWYLTVLAVAGAIGARILAARNGDLTPKEEGLVPPPPAVPPPPPPPKWTRV